MSAQRSVGLVSHQTMNVLLQVDYDPDSLELLRNGSTFFLINWKAIRYLNSHNVASASSKRNYEVSGFANYQTKRKSQVYSGVRHVTL